MQVIAQQGVKTGARRLGTAAVHDLRMYSEAMREQLRGEAKILYDTDRSHLNEVIYYDNEFSEWFKSIAGKSKEFMQNIQDVNEFKEQKKEFDRKVEEILKEKVKEYFKQKKADGIVKKNRGWQSKRYSYNMVISIDRELKSEVILGHIKEEDVIEAMKNAYNRIAEEIGINTIYVAVHRDETTPHLHVMAANICKNGKALTGMVKLMKSKPYQMSFPEFTDRINKYAEEELQKMGYTIHLEVSHRNFTGKHKDVKTLRLEYIQKIESDIVKLRQENVILKRRLGIQISEEYATTQAKDHIEEVKAIWTKQQQRER